MLLARFPGTAVLTSIFLLQYTGRPAGRLVKMKSSKILLFVICFILMLSVRNKYV